MTNHRPASDLLTIKWRSGGTTEFRGSDIPSLPSLLLLFKRRRLKAKAESLRVIKAQVAELKRRMR